MSKTKQLIGFVIVCAIVVLLLFLVSELRKYQSSNNEQNKVIKSIVDMFRTECITEKKLDKSNLSNEDQLLISECFDQKIKQVKDSIKTKNND